MLNSEPSFLLTTRRHVISAVGLALFVLLAFGSVDSGGNRQDSPSSDTSVVPAPPTPKEEALKAVKLDYKWRKGGFDNVMEADFTISNPTPYAIKDVEITCVHFAPSGTPIDSNRRTIYERIRPKGKKVVKDFNMGFIHSQVKSSACSITDLVVEP
jgi:hypothetical protein